ncbi:hypothetical protein B484DRAFT_410044, partial [Ochromonadaceae sp. CCMP2298]
QQKEQGSPSTLGNNSSFDRAQGSTLDFPEGAKHNASQIEYEQKYERGQEHEQEHDQGSYHENHSSNFPSFEVNERLRIQRGEDEAREMQLVCDWLLRSNWRTPPHFMADPSPAEGNFFSQEEATILRHRRIVEQFLTSTMAYSAGAQGDLRHQQDQSRSAWKGLPNAKAKWLQAEEEMQRKELITRFPGGGPIKPVEGEPAEDATLEQLHLHALQLRQAMNRNRALRKLREKEELEMIIMAARSEVMTEVSEWEGDVAGERQSPGQNL